jgi:hypothetical protein
MKTAGSYSRRWTPIVLILALALIVPLARSARAQSAAQGLWTTLPDQMPINPVHLALLNNGSVLVVSGSGNVAAETNYRAAVWDPVQGTIAVQQLAYDMFCNGMVTLPDGRVFVNGGNLQYDPFHGQLRNAAFDPGIGVFTNLENMAHGRWYPTVTVLGDGRVMTFSGLNETGATNSAVEIYTPGSGWSPEYPSGWTPPLYPRMHLLPNGKVFYSGSGRDSRIFDPTAKTWSAAIATTNYSGTRTYGTSVLLPLSPVDGYRARVMIFGGGNPATATTEIIEPLAATPAWSFGPAMSQGRIEMNATILPNGKVLALGGSVNDEDAATASLNADLYDPATNTFSPAGANVYPASIIRALCCCRTDGSHCWAATRFAAATKGTSRSIRRRTCSTRMGRSPPDRPSLAYRRPPSISGRRSRFSRRTPAVSPPSCSYGPVRRHMRSIWISAWCG